MPKRRSIREELESSLSEEEFWLWLQAGITEARLALVLLDRTDEKLGLIWEKLDFFRLLCYKWRRSPYIHKTEKQRLIQLEADTIVTLSAINQKMKQELSPVPTDDEQIVLSKSIQKRFERMNKIARLGRNRQLSVIKPNDLQTIAEQQLHRQKIEKITPLPEPEEPTVLSQSVQDIFASLGKKVPRQESQPA